MVVIDDVSLIPLGGQDNTPVLLDIGKDTTVCGSFVQMTLNAQKGFLEYHWNTGDTTSSVTINKPGKYYCTVRHHCGYYTDTITIKQQPLLSIRLGKDTIICDDKPFLIPLNAGAGFDSYLWNSNARTPTIYANRPGTYWIKATYACGTVYDTITIKTQLSQNYSVDIGKDTIVCGNGNFSIKLQASHFSSYLWNTGEITNSITVTKPGKYWLKADSVCGSATDTILIKQQPFLNVQLGNDTTLCSTSQPLILTASSGFDHYLWNTGENSQQITIKNSGMYSVKATSYCNTSIDSVRVTIQPVPSLPLTTDKTYCLFSTAAALTANGFNLQWYTDSTATTGDTTAPIPFTDKTGNMRYFVSQTINGCESKKSALQITVIDKPDFSLGSEQVICNEIPVSIGPAHSGWKYKWNDGITASPRKISQPAIYILTASNECGSKSDSIRISIEDCTCSFYFANTFTPNGDELNDEYSPVFTCKLLSSYQLEIFNRWGERIFETTDPARGWDGSLKGKPAQQDVYVIRLTYKSKNYAEKIIYKRIALIR